MNQKCSGIIRLHFRANSTSGKMNLLYGEMVKTIVLGNYTLFKSKKVY